MKNIVSVDLEDWFHLPILRGNYPIKKWDFLEETYLSNTRYLLELFESKNIKATFFVLGWVAKKSPELLKEIYDKGHEIGSHGFYHNFLTRITKEEFEIEIHETNEAIYNAIKLEPKGFRAPGFSITKKTSDYYQILAKYNFQYSSSVFPISLHPEYGWQDFGIDPKRMNNIIEIPMSVLRLGNFNMPVSGGAYFRYYPYLIFKKFTQQLNFNNRVLNFYIHPWELNSRMNYKGSTYSKLRHKFGTSVIKKRLNSLFDTFEFINFNQYIKDNYGC